MGLRAHQMYGSALPPGLILMGTTLLASAACSIAALVLTFILFAALKADETITWSWAVVFIPAWIVDCAVGVMVGCMICSLRQPPEEDEEDEPSKPYSFIVNYFLLLAFQILAVMKLDESISWSWVVVFAPFYGVEAIWFASKLHFVMTAPAEAPKLYIAYREYRTYVAQLLFLIFLVQRLDGIITWNWAFIFMPLYLGLALFWLADSVEGYLSLRSAPEEAQDEAKQFFRFEVLMNLFCHSFAYIFLALLVVRLNTMTLSAITVFIPLITFFGCVCCCCCLATVTTCMSSEPDLGEFGSRSFGGDEEKDQDLTEGGTENASPAAEGAEAGAAEDKKENKDATPVAETTTIDIPETGADDMD